MVIKIFSFLFFICILNCHLYPASITGIHCPKVDHEDLVESSFNHLFPLMSIENEELSLLINFLDNYNPIGSDEVNRCSSNSDESLINKSGKNKRILILGSENSSYQSMAKKYGFYTYDTLTCNPLDKVQEFVSKKYPNLNIDCYFLGANPNNGWKKVLVHKMIFNVEEIHFLIGSSYSYIKDPKSKIQHMINSWASGKSRYLTDWEMWFINCSKFSSLLKFKLEYHQD